MALCTVMHLSLFLLAVVLLGVQGCSRDDAAAYNNSGIALAKMGKHAEACEKFAKAVEIDPRFATAYFDWGWALVRMGKTAEAIEKFDKAAALDPTLKARLDDLRTKLLGKLLGHE